MTKEQFETLKAVALGWLGTPYHSQQGVKGVGVDCVHLPAKVFAEAGFVAQVSVGFYPADWHLHRHDELYVLGVEQYADRVELVDRGDLILMRYGRAFSHGAIYLGDDTIIHAWRGRPVELARLSDFSDKPQVFYRVRV